MDNKNFDAYEYCLWMDKFLWGVFVSGSYTEQEVQDMNQSLIEIYTNEINKQKEK